MRGALESRLWRLATKLISAEIADFG